MLHENSLPKPFLCCSKNVAKYKKFDDICAFLQIQKIQEIKGCVRSKPMVKKRRKNKCNGRLLANNKIKQRNSLQTEVVSQNNKME